MITEAQRAFQGKKNMHVGTEGPQAQLLQPLALIVSLPPPAQVQLWAPLSSPRLEHVCGQVLEGSGFSRSSVIPREQLKEKILLST